MDRGVIALNGFERETRGLVRFSLLLVALPVLAIGIALLVLGLHEGRAPNGFMLAAGRHVTYYVNASRVVAGSTVTLVGLAMVSAASRPGGLRR